MKVKTLGKKNITEVSFSDWRILVSYETPVAAIFTENEITRIYKTSKFHSQTTSKHINQWLRDIFGYDPNIEELPQGYFDQLLER